MTMYYLCMHKYTDINRRTIDKWASEGWEWATPVSHEDYMEALAGKARILLTPTKPVPSSWLGDVKGKKVLALAGGGGQQGPLLNALGADVTVLDNSGSMLALDKDVADREGYSISLIQADMTEPLPFGNNTFDLIINPVSTCYIEDPSSLWKECWRILREGGKLLAGLDNGINYIVDEEETMIAHALPYNPLRNPEQWDELDEEADGIQFSHSHEEIIQGMIDAGFTIRGIYADTNSSGRLKEMAIPAFYALFAAR